MKQQPDALGVSINKQGKKISRQDKKSTERTKE
jgi:hypothetical protein